MLLTLLTMLPVLLTVRVAVPDEAVRVALGWMVRQR
jgi:hypothetical protein